MQTENYTLNIEEDFFAGIIAGDFDEPEALSEFVSTDDRGTLAVGKSVTVTNTLGELGTLYLAIPTSSYHPSTFEITTMGYPIRLTAGSEVEGHTIIAVGTIQNTRNLTFEIARI